MKLAGLAFLFLWISVPAIGHATVCSPGLTACPCGECSSNCPECTDFALESKPHTVYVIPSSGVFRCPKGHFMEQIPGSDNWICSLINDDASSQNASSSKDDASSKK